MGSAEFRQFWFEVQKNKNKGLLFLCLTLWSVCIATFAYQYLGGFVHWPYWCLIHLTSVAGPVLMMLVGSNPVESPPPLHEKLFFILFCLSCIPLLTVMPPVQPDWFNALYVFMTFLAVDMSGCGSIASLNRNKYTFYWPLICLVFSLALSSGVSANPVWCKIVVCCCGVAVAALSTLYLYLRRQRLVSDETPSLTFARCFV